MKSNTKEKVKIGGFDYIIEYIPHFEKDDHEGLNGRVDPDTVSIQINASTAPQMQAECLVHEITHAIIRNAALHDYISNDELFVRAFAAGLYQVIKDNPHIIKKIK